MFSNNIFHRPTVNKKNRCLTAKFSRIQQNIDNLTAVLKSNQNRRFFLS